VLEGSWRRYSTEFARGKADKEGRSTKVEEILTVMEKLPGSLRESWGSVVGFTGKSGVSTSRVVGHRNDKS